MILLIMFLLFSLSLAILLFLFSYYLVGKVNLTFTKLSAFECGFDPKSLARNPFSLRFFIITLIFLVFDVELALSLPIPFVVIVLSNFVTFMFISLFFGIILLGLYVEWWNGALQWQT